MIYKLYRVDCWSSTIDLYAVDASDAVNRLRKMYPHAQVRSVRQLPFHELRVEAITGSGRMYIAYEI